MKYYIKSENLEVELSKLEFLSDQFKSSLIQAAPPKYGWLVIETCNRGISVRDINPKDIPADILINKNYEH